MILSFLRFVGFHLCAEHRLVFLCIAHSTSASPLEMGALRFATVKHTEQAAMPEQPVKITASNIVLPPRCFCRFAVFLRLDY